MSFIESIISPQLSETIGRTILHSLWQGGVIGVLLYTLLISSRTRTAALRYNLALGGILTLIAASAITFILIYSSLAPLESTPVSEAIPAGAQTAPLVFMVQADAQAAAGTDLMSMLMPLLSFGWLAGILFLSVRFMGGLIYVQRLKSRNIASLEEMQEMLSEVCARLEVAKPVKLMRSALVNVPVTIGYFKPVILMPAGIITGLPAAELEAVLAHEIAHIKRNDYLVNILQSVAEILFFYHPAMYWMNNVARKERENCCDDLAIEMSGNPLPLARALAMLEESASPSLALAATGSGQLLQRIKRMLAPAEASASKRPGAALVLLLGFLLVGLGAFTSGNEGKNENDTLAPAATDTLNIFLPEVDLIAYENEGDTIKNKQKKDDKKEVIILYDEGGKATGMYIDGKKVPDDKLAEEEAKYKAGEVIRLDEESGRKIAKEMEQSSKAIEDISVEMEKAAKKIEEAARMLEKVKIPDVPEIPDMKQHEQAMAEYEKKMKAYEEVMREYEKEMRKYEEQMRPYEIEMRKYEEKMKPYEEEMRKYEARHDKFMEVLEAELLHDKLIKNKKKYMFKIDAENLFIDGEKQSPELYEKYRKLYKNAMGEDVKKLEKDNSYMIIKN